MLPHTLVVEEFASLGVRWCESYGCQYIHKHTPNGYSSSVNIGLKHAKEKGYTHVVTINQDIEMLAPVLVPFVRGFRLADIVGGTLFYPGGKIQSAGWFYRPDMCPLEYEKHKPQNSCELWKKERFVGGVTGALKGFSLELGLYDESFPMSYEDVEYCIRALLADKKILYTPTISAVHHESAIRGRHVGEAELISFERYKEVTETVSAALLNAKVEAYNSGNEQQ